MKETNTTKTLQKTLSLLLNFSRQLLRNVTLASENKFRKTNKHLLDSNVHNNNNRY